MPAGKGGGGRGPLPREVLVSKKLSWLLRHGAEKEGLQLGEAGYISLKDVLENRNIRSLKVTFDEVKQIVVENDKQRFSLIHKSAAPSTKQEDETAAAATPDTVPQHDSNNPADYLIRANQGHSLVVESEGLLTPMTEENLPSTVVHGTTHFAWPLIVSSGGLNKMGRTHVHFASGLPAGFKSITESPAPAPASPITEEGDGNKTAQPPVISGMRKSSSVLIFLDIKKAMQAGLKFWLSENGVILSQGDENGVIGLEFFRSVEDRTGGLGLLVQDGVVVKEAPESWATKGSGKRGGKRGGGGGGGGRGQSSS